MLRKTSKPMQEYFLVATGDQAMRTSGAAYGTGSAMFLSSGQLGVIRPELGTYINGTGTAVTNGVMKIQILQGTSKSANMSGVTGWTGLEVPECIKSPVIPAHSIMQVSTKLPVIGTYSSLLYSGLSTPTADTKYSLNVKLRSVRKDKTFGGNVEQLSSVYVSGITAPTQATVLSNLVTKLNVYSKANNLVPPHKYMGNRRHVLAFGIDSTGAGGSGTVVNTLTLGSTLNVMTDGTNTLSITVTKEMIQTVYNWIGKGSITASSRIVNVSTSAAGSSTVDAIAVMGLDHSEAVAYDDTAQVRVDVTGTTITWPDGTYTETTLANAVETTGSGRFYKIQFQDRAFGQEGNEQLAGFTDTIIYPVELIDETAMYTATAIDFTTEEAVNNDVSHQNVRIWILLPATDNSGSATPTAGITTSTSASVNTVPNLNSILGNWLLSNDRFTTNGSATQTQLFV